ncbi:MAG: hypothetical protein U0802_07380 [Candidatus Binatia bacterium]
MWRSGIAPCAAATGVLLVLASGCAVRRPIVSEWAAPFVLTFWCGPPLPIIDDARMAQVADAGFTTVGAPCEGDLDEAGNRRLLALAERHGLRVWVADHRLYAAAAGAPDAAALTAAVAQAYRDAPALDGYVVADEPTVDDFPRLAAVVAALGQADAARLAYVNLLPDYVPPANLGAVSYADYLEQFVATVRPRALSVDYYPFGEHRDRSTFFANLAALRETALRHDLPFLWIMLAMPHGPYRDPTESELAWQAFHALAYGARGVSYFTYWTPPPGDWQHRRGLIENGQPTARYGEAQRLNRQLRAVGDALGGWRSLAVADSRGEVAAPLPIGPLQAVDGGDFTIGFFGDGAGGIAALLVNRDYRAAATATLRLRDGAPPPELLSAQGWRPMAALALPLDPGGARLLRWAG